MQDKKIPESCRWPSSHHQIPNISIDRNLPNHKVALTGYFNLYSWKANRHSRKLPFLNSGYITIAVISIRGIAWSIMQAIYAKTVNSDTNFNSTSRLHISPTWLVFPFAVPHKRGCRPYPRSTDQVAAASNDFKRRNGPTPNHAYPRATN